MPVCIKTNFIDYYDHWFDREGYIFERRSDGGMSRREMFAFLRHHGSNVPIYGTPADICRSLGNQGSNPEKKSPIKVVVYLDERAHRGEGKILVPIEYAQKEYPDSLCSMYYPGAGRAESIRYLQIGDLHVWLKYVSLDWRSNVEPEIIVLSEIHKGYHPTIHFPLFAIDFVSGNTQRADQATCLDDVCNSWIAVDFNISPGIRGTGIENALSAKEAAEAIRRAVSKQQESRGAQKDHR